MKDVTNRKFWDRFAWAYTGAMKGSQELYDDINNRIVSELKGDEKVLELASGTGQISFAVAPHAKSYTATDFSPNMIQNGRKRQTDNLIKFEFADATNLKYEDESFDVVIIANALHIMPYPDKAMAEIRRVLRPGGKLFAPTFCLSTTKAGRFRIRVMSLGGFKTYTLWDDETFTEFLRKHGFVPGIPEILGPPVMPLIYVSAVKEN